MVHHTKASPRLAQRDLFAAPCRRAAAVEIERRGLVKISYQNHHAREPGSD
jgi:hypothetical protein